MGDMKHKQWGGLLLFYLLYINPLLSSIFSFFYVEKLLFLSEIAELPPWFAGLGS